MRKRLTIVVPDATRPLDYAAILPQVLEHYSDHDLTVLVALGLHRPMTDEELAPVRAVCDRFGATLAQHDPESTVDGFAPQVVDTDRIINVGVVEPHQYAGFSGGVKGVAIGCAASEVIAEMHSLRMLRACGAKVGWIDGNPFQEKLWALVADLPRIDGLFVVPGHEDVFIGAARPAFDAAVAVARELHFHRLDEAVGSMLLKVPETKAASFYQASRAATYVALAESPAIEPGGTLYVDAPCPEGVGLGAGEHACADAMKKGVERLLGELRSEEPPKTRGGEQRAYVLAMALENVDIVLVGAPEIAELTAMGIEQLDSAPAVDLVVDDPFHAVPGIAVS